jgi:triacylglycerol lipase
MPPSYDRPTAQLLASFVGLAYAQFQSGNPEVTLPDGWTQTASFRAPEIGFGTLSATPAMARAAHDLDAHALRALIPAVGVRTVLFGFAASGPNFNCIVLRGTRTAEEVVVDLTGVQVDVPLIWKLQLAKVHLGFLIMFAFLYEQIQAAAQALGSSKPLFFSGHSLGSALATLGALDVDLQVFAGGGASGQVQLYDFASPRVGDPIFQGAYDAALPGTFRVVNLADVVPLLPPTSITVAGVTYLYAHVGQEWSYLWQTGNVEGNHSLSFDYEPALLQQVETDASRTFPASGL